jgi:hypothetical protein
MTPRSTFQCMLIVVAIALVGVQTTTLAQDAYTLREDARAFTPKELHNYLSGKTQVWDPNGGAYYAEDGILQTLWDGERDSGTWSITEDGELCWHVDSWGEYPCEAYFHNGELVSYLYEGDTGPAPELQSGNTLDYLQAFFDGDVGYVPSEAAEDIDPDFTRNLFTPEEATAFVVGKTVILDPLGGAYYAPNFTLMAVWNGVRQSGTWSVNDDGGVCWHLAAWGVEPCRYYYYKDDVLMSLYKDKDWRAEELIEGNTLDAF